MFGPSSTGIQPVESGRTGFQPVNRLHDAGGAEGILAGDRFERYYYAGWRVLELRDNAETNQTLGQFVYGTQYIDEPIAYDRDTDGDDDCLEAEGSRRYFYHQDANHRVAALTDEDGFVVERYEYDAYGEQVVYNGGTSSELGDALPASTVGNPLMHQGLWRDAESGSYQNRYRQYASALGRFGQRDPLAHRYGMNSLAYVIGNPGRYVDPLGLEPIP